MKIGLVGMAPLPQKNASPVLFGQLRTWSILRFLQHHDFDIELFLLSDSADIDGHIIHSPHTAQAVSKLCERVDCIVTAGPFLPALILDALDPNIPLFLDWPSDPLADQHAKRLVTEINQSDESIVLEIVHRALRRADAISVISQRQYWAVLGQLLLLGREDTPIYVVPIAYDFPEKPIAKKKSASAILLSGSLNTWLNIDIILQTIHECPELHLHCTGGVVSHNPQAQDIVYRWKNLLNERLCLHGWLNSSELNEVLSDANIGVWLDNEGIEPLLGSRTRALFYIWHGVKIIASNTTELAAFLESEGALVQWDLDVNFKELIERANAIDIPSAQELCIQYFSPQRIYMPLLNWLNDPKHLLREDRDWINEENQRLRRELQAIFSSKTWRISNALHKFISFQHRKN